MPKLSSAELAKREDVIMKMKKNKRSLVKRYGPDAEKVMYGRATNIAKKVAESEMEKSNLKELVRAALMNEKAGFSKEYDDNPALKGGQKNLPDGLQKSIIDKAANEDLDLGHQDNEPHMLKGDLYRIGKYAMELYQMVDEFEGQGEIDFPHWWQAKIINAREAIESAKHYLDFETKEPQIDAMVDVAAEEEVIDENALGMTDSRLSSDQHRDLDYAVRGDSAYTFGNDPYADDQLRYKYAKKMGFLEETKAIKEGNLGHNELASLEKEGGSWIVTYRTMDGKKEKVFTDEDEARAFMNTTLEEGLPKGYFKKATAELDESFEKLVGKLKKGGKSEKAAKAIAGAVASYKAKGGGKGPTAKQKARINEMYFLKMDEYTPGFSEIENSDIYKYKVVYYKDKEGKQPFAQTIFKYEPNYDKIFAAMNSSSYFDKKYVQLYKAFDANGKEYPIAGDPKDISLSTLKALGFRDKPELGWQAG